MGGRVSDERPVLAPRHAARAGVVAGAVASLVMLAGIVALRLATGVTSLPEVVADGVLLALPGTTFSAILDALRGAAKPLLYLGVGGGAVAVGGLLGRWYAAEPGWRRTAGLAIGTWLVFGLGVYPAAGAGLFGSTLRAGPSWHAAALFALFGLYAGTLHLLFDRLQRAAQECTVPGAAQGRRALLRAATVVGLVAVGGVGWRRLQRASQDGVQVPTGGLAPVAANPPPFDVAGLSPEVTPTATFYTVSKNMLDPAVDAGSWRLRVDGLVERPVELTYEQVRQLPQSAGFYTLMCISNEVGGDLIGNAHWRGTTLRWLLGQAGVRDGALKVVFSAADGYKDSVRLDRALHPDALLAWEMNGQPLAKEHGFPVRLLIPDIYGMKNVKWLTGITLVREDFKGYWQVRGWDDEAVYRTTSRIDVPPGRATLAGGPIEVAGIAYAGDRGIQRVEVSADGGQTWQDARVKPALSPYAWQLWRARVEVAPGGRTVRVRATDGEGERQASTAEPPFPAGASGYHAISVAVTA